MYVGGWMDANENAAKAAVIRDIVTDAVSKRDDVPD